MNYNQSFISNVHQFFWFSLDLFHKCPCTFYLQMYKVFIKLNFDFLLNTKFCGKKNHGQSLYKYILR